MKTGTRSDFGTGRPGSGPPSRSVRDSRDSGAGDRMAALSALVESITEQIDAIEGASRRGLIQRAVQNAAARPPEPPQELARSAPAEGPGIGPSAERQRDDRLGSIEARLSALAGQFTRRTTAAMDEPPARPAFEEQPFEVPREAEPVRGRGETLGSLQAAIAEISARQQVIDDEGGRHLGTVDSIAIEDAITALRGDIATLGRRLGAEARRNEEMDRALRSEIAAHFGRQPASGEGGLFDDIRAHLSEIRQAIELSAREATLASVEAGYGHMIERLDDIVRSIPDRDRMEGLADEIGRLGGLIEKSRPGHAMEADIEDIRNAIASLSTARAEGLEGQIAELRRVVEQLAASAHAPDLSHIDEQLAAIRLLIEDGRPQAAVIDESALTRLEARIDALSGRFDAIIDLPSLQAAPLAGEAMEGLRSELSQLREHIVVREPARFDAIDEQMRALMQRLDTAASREDGGSLAQLEAQVGALAERLSAADPGTGALAKVEANLDRLQALFGESRSETIEAARDAARSTFSEFAGRLPTGPDDALVAALREDLRNLQASAMRSDRQNHDTLEAVHDTLAKVVERISQLEALETMQSAVEGARTARAAAADELPEDHRPLAPGSGKPDLFAMREAEAGAPATRPGDRKADFIAAARRAAQAAQAETARMEAEPEEPQAARPGALARIGQALRSRRRPLVLAIAAVVLALGAVQYGPEIQQRAIDAAKSLGLDRTATASVAPAMPVPAAPRAAKTAPASPAKATSGLVAPSTDAGSLAFEPPAPIASRFADAAGPAASAFTTAAAPEAAASSIDFALVETAAGKGDAVAAFALAKHLAEGDLRDRDLARAALWYERAAKGGIAIAQYRIGSLYERGEGVKRDTVAAERWYEKASAQGNARAAHNLAVMTSEGANGAPDYARAAELFIRAGELGVADSQYNLGVLYARGLGVEVDLVRSYQWFALAAAQGDQDAGKRRDEVARAMTPDDLAAARAAVKAFQTKPLDVAANTEPATKAAWLQPLPQTTAFDSVALGGTRG